MRRTPRLLTLIGLAACTAIALAGCSTGPATDGATGGGGLTIVTTTTQITDFVQQLTDGTGATVTPLLAPGASAHGFEAKPADLVALGQADLVVASGLGLENWLDAALASAGYDGAVVEAADGFDPHVLHESPGHAAAAGADAEPAPTPTAAPTDDHTDDGHADEHADDGHANDHADPAHPTDSAHPDDTGHDEHADDAAADDHAADDHDGHDHGDDDPHVWTAPAGARYMVAQIADALVAADPAGADAIRANAASYDAKLEALDRWVGENIGAVPVDQRLLITNHHSFGAYADEFHVTVVGSILPSFDDNAEPSAQEIDALVAAIRASGATAVFSETQLSSTLAERIANEAGVTVYQGDDALSTDALGAAGTPTATYIGATVHNTTMILDSWGATASALPQELDAA